MFYKKINIKYLFIYIYIYNYAVESKFLKPLQSQESNKISKIRY
jgi:hypothetical protein